MDGALLLFDRATGMTAVCDGEETAHLRMRAPREVQFAITNACNLACTGRMALKLDICWGERMETVPTLFGVGSSRPVTRCSCTSAIPSACRRSSAGFFTDTAGASSWS